jgi:hypothetical protein
MRIKACVAFLLLCSFPIISLAEDLAPFSAKVSVSVTAQDNIKGLIESYIGRELRSLGDIVVSDDNPRWIISILAIEQASRSGQKLGVVMSTAITESFDNGLILDKVSADRKEIVSFLTTGLCHVSGHWINTGATDELRLLCDQTVAQFDSSVIKPARTSYQNYKDFMQQKKPSATTRKK